MLCLLLAMLVVGALTMMGCLSEVAALSASITLLADASYTGVDGFTTIGLVDGTVAGTVGTT